MQFSLVPNMTVLSDSVSTGVKIGHEQSVGKFSYCGITLLVFPANEIGHCTNNTHDTIIRTVGTKI